MHPSLALLYHITATPINITLSLRNILLQTGHFLLNMLLLLNCSRISHKWHQACPTTVTMQCNEIPWCSLLQHMENEACNRFSWRYPDWACFLVFIFQIFLFSSSLSRHFSCYLFLDLARLFYLNLFNITTLSLLLRLSFFLHHVS